MPPATAEGGSADARPLVIGIDLGGTKCHGVLARMDGTGVLQDVRPTHRDDAYATVLACAGSLQAQAAAAGRTVAAIGLGVPAVVDDESGRVMDGPNVGWHGFRLHERLIADLGLPVAIENDANLSALGEARHGAARGISDFVVLSIGTGIGGAVVVDGHLRKGCHNAAGEFGAMVLDRSQLGERTCGGLGWFERVAAGPGVGARASRMQTDDVRSRGAARHAASDMTAQAVLAAARAGDASARATLDLVLDDIAMAMIALICVVDPRMVILDGGLGRALAAELDGLLERVARHAPAMPAVTISALAPTSTVVGALVAAADAAGSPAPTPGVGSWGRSPALAGDELTGGTR